MSVREHQCEHPYVATIIKVSKEDNLQRLLPTIRNQIRKRPEKSLPDQCEPNKNYTESQTQHSDLNGPEPKVLLFGMRTKKENANIWQCETLCRWTILPGLAYYEHKWTIKIDGIDWLSFLSSTFTSINQQKNYQSNTTNTSIRVNIAFDSNNSSKRTKTLSSEDVE